MRLPLEVHSPRLSGLLVAAVLQSAAPEVWATPDPCSPNAGPTAICAGNQSKGVIAGADFSANTPAVLVQNLNADIMPVAGVTGISHFLPAAGNVGLKVTFIGGGHRILTEGPAAHGIWVGGQAPNGGHGAAVTVTSEASISTIGDQSTGIFAQSVGKGGGNGGFSFAGGFSPAGKLAAKLSVGGFGGGGSAAGVVKVTNHGDIFVNGDGSMGIHAQSVGGGGGGGGGSGGSTSNISLTQEGWNPTKNETSWHVKVGIGGSGGTGNHGGPVIIDNSGSIITHGNDSIAINAFSIGGGGGEPAATPAGFPRFRASIRFRSGRPYRSTLAARGMRAEMVAKSR